MERQEYPNITRSSGMVLIVSLIFLLIVVILGVTVMNVSTVEEKMAAGMRDKDMAFQAAEIALRRAERRIESTIRGSGLFTMACNDGLCAALNADSVNTRWEDDQYCGTDQDIWQCNKSHEIDLSGVEGDQYSRNPRYIIEVVRRISNGETLMLGNLGDSSLEEDMMVFRITAVGYGGSTESKVILQSTYGKRI